jgi:hypothetical protein
MRRNACTSSSKMVYFCPIVTKMTMCPEILLNLPNVKSHEIPFSGSLAVSCARMYIADFIYSPEGCECVWKCVTHILCANNQKHDDIAKNMYLQSWQRKCVKDHGKANITIKEQFKSCTHSAVYLVEALCHKREGRGFKTRWGHWIFQLT